MKKLLLLSALSIFTFGVSQSTTYIPDDIFEQKLIDLGFDDVLDNYVLTANISSVENLNLDNEENFIYPGSDVIDNYIPYEISGAIYDLTGIQDFTSLVSLDVGFNRISSLDLSNNFSLAYLDCEYNDILSELILPSSGPNGSESPLGFIYGRINAISSIDLTNSPNLHTAYFQRNLIPQINVQFNPLLETLIISQNSFTEINVCYNPLLFMFMFNNNNISELDISNNPLITNLYGHNTLLSCVRVSDLDNPYLDDPYIYPYYWFDEGVEFSLDCGFVNQCEPCQIDTTPPELTCPDDQTASADTGCMFNIPDYTGLATATDNCAVTSITQDPIAGTMVDTGSLIITLTASDGINTTDCSFILSVIDTTPPELTCPDDQTASADTGCMFNIPDYTGLATASDNCAVTSIIQEPIAGTMVNTGSLIITLTASDGINTTDCSFILSVIDNTPPELTCPDDQTVDSEGPYSLPDYFATGQATAIDNCTDSVTNTDQIPNPGALLENGTYIITLTAQDENGLEGECSFTLVVNDLLLETQTNELSLSDLRLYPNPASDKVIISNPGLLELETISVYDLNGRLMIRNNIEGIESITIDTSILQSATYMIVIESKYGNIIKRLLIE